MDLYMICKDTVTIDMIKRALEHARKKHPVSPKDPIHRAAIVAEESGELIQAVLNFVEGKGKYSACMNEAIQTAVTCIRFLTMK